MSTAISLCNFDPLSAIRKESHTKDLKLRPSISLKTSDRLIVSNRSHCYQMKRGSRSSHRFTVFAATEGSAKSKQVDETIPSWARSDSDEPPPWAREEGSGSTSQPAFQLPYYAYLLASAVVAIAAIGSIFEYVNQRPVFGVLNFDSVFYVPLLGFFVFAGIPTSAFLWFKSVEMANKEAEEQDRRDGYR